MIDLKLKIAAKISSLHPEKKTLKLNEFAIEQIYFEMTGGANTRITVKILDNCKYFKGSVIVRYKRFNIEQYLKGLELPEHLKEYGNLHSILDELKYTYGLPFNKEQYPDITINVNTTSVTLYPYEDTLEFIPLTSIEIPFN